MKKGRAGTMTHDYKRNGATTLFAALSMLDGKAIGACLPHHRHREFLRLLRLIEHETPADLDLHLVVDNYATHKTPAVKRRLKAHPRSICTSRRPRRRGSTWSSVAFAEITCNRIRRGEDAVVTARRGVRWSPVARPPDEERYRTQISATARQRGAARARGKDGGPIAVERRSQTKIAPPVPPPPRCEQTA